MTRMAAARLVRSARLVHAHEPTATALWKGDLSVSHVELMASAIRRREDVFASDGEPLLDAATQCTPEEFRVASAGVAQSRG